MKSPKRSALAYQAEYQFGNDNVLTATFHEELCLRNKARIRNAQPAIQRRDICVSDDDPFVNNAKRIQQDQDRQDVIAQHNLLLLDRLEKIHTRAVPKQFDVSHLSDEILNAPRASNASLRRRQQAKIDAENLQMQARLHKTTGTFNTQQIAADAERHRYFSDQISKVGRRRKVEQICKALGDRQRQQNNVVVRLPRDNSRLVDQDQVCERERVLTFDQPAFNYYYEAESDTEPCLRGSRSLSRLDQTKKSGFSAPRVQHKDNTTTKLPQLGHHGAHIVPGCSPTLANTTKLISALDLPRHLGALNANRLGGWRNLTEKEALTGTIRQRPTTITSPTLRPACRCGQSWSSPGVKHFCELIERDVDVNTPSSSSRATFFGPRQLRQRQLRTGTTASVLNEPRSFPSRSGDHHSVMPESTKTTGAAMQNGPETTSSVSTSDAEAAAPLPPRRNGGVSENIQVFIRIRPLIDRETSQERTAGSHSIRATDSQTIEVRTADTTLRCSYDAVFDPSVSQEQVYERVAECTQAFLQGFNATLFAYGQTGSGKSFTMFGAETDLSRYRPGLQKSSAGVIPRAIKDIFASVVQKEAAAAGAGGPSAKRDGVQSVTVYCSFVQIYNEQIFDLLRDSNMNTPLEIHEDRKNGIYVEGLSEYAVHSVNDCLTLLQCGEQHRAVRSTHMNQVSSRSHSVFQLMLEQCKQDGSVLKSKLNLVDLAGSEKWNSDSMMQHHHISEMTNINLSLHTLGRCIASLSTKTSGPKHVPYRDSKLTRLLQDSLGGNTKTKIIATLSPSMDCIDESISTLKFADRAKQVMVLVRVNEQREIDPAYVEKLQDELEQLREVVRLLRSSSSSSNNNNADEHDGDLRSRLVRVLNENTEMKRQIEKQRQELEQLRRQSGSSGQATNGSHSSEFLDPSVQLAKQQLENTLRQLKDASDRFFRFEIEEDELKSIHTKVFQQAPIGTIATTGGTAGGQKGTFAMSLTKPKPRSFTSSSPAANESTVKGTPSVVPDLLYRVRNRGASLSEPSSGSGDWKRDGGALQNGKSAAAVDVEKELALSRKAIEKQTKLQNWLMEKEKRELLKLQQEQQFLEEQRRAAAEKDAKFYKHAAATKKKLLSAAAASPKPSTAEV